MNRSEQELYDVGIAYYILAAIAIRQGMDSSAYRAKEHLWLNLRSIVIIDGITQPNEILGRAYESCANIRRRLK